MMDILTRYLSLRPNGAFKTYGNHCGIIRSGDCVQDNLKTTGGHLLTSERKGKREAQLGLPPEGGIVSPNKQFVLYGGAHRGGLRFWFRKKTAEVDSEFKIKQCIEQLEKTDVLNRQQE